jgi:beta-lactamase regulating signal transducer with metallopeptidase domain
MNYSMEALGWTLIHFCWQAAVIALLYRGVDASLAKARSNVRYVVSLTTLLSMFAVSVVTFGYEAMRSSENRVKMQTPVTVASSGGSIEVAPGKVADSGVDVAFSGPLDISADIVRVMPWLDAFWLLGVLCLSVRTVGGWWLLQHVRRNALVQVPASVLKTFTRLAARMGIRQHVDLRACERIAGPLAMGIVRRLVLLPASALTSLTAEQLEVVLAHELAHIRRADYLWNMLQTMIETLFFFHPAVWWVSNSLREQRELCCDDAALACCSDPMVYATALLCLEEQRGSRLHLAMALDGHQAAFGLKTRIVRILGEAPQGRRDIVPFSLLGVCAMLGLFLMPLPHVLAWPHPQMQALRAVVVDASVPDPKVAVDASPEARPTPVVASAGKVSASPNRVATPIVATTAVAAPVAVARAAVVAQTASSAAQSAAANSSAKIGYVDQMRAAGYDVDLDKYIAMKIQGITPEYARSMAAIGFGKPTADQLVAMKIHGVTPAYVSELRASGMEAKSFEDLIEYRIFQVTPEYIAAMKAAGFGQIPTKKLVELRIHGVTPEFAKTTKQQYPDVTVDQLAQLRIFHIDEAFIADAKRHGFDNLTIEKLVKLRISGLLDDDERSEKK